MILLLLDFYAKKSSNFEGQIYYNGGATFQGFASRNINNSNSLGLTH
jgi:hypothetical protein